MKMDNLLLLVFLALFLFIFFAPGCISDYIFCKNNFKNEKMACMISSKYNIGTIKK